LFSWGKIKDQLIDAVADLQKILSNNGTLVDLNSDLRTQNSSMSKDLEIAISTRSKQETEIENLKTVKQQDTNKINEMTAELVAKETTIQNQIDRISEFISNNKILTLENSNLVEENKRLTNETATNKETVANLSNRKVELEIELSGIKEKLRAIQEELNNIKQQNTQLLTDEENRKQKYEEETATLTSITKRIQEDRIRENDERQQQEITRLQRLKETWSKHQINVKSIVKTICNKHTIEYIDNVPFKGEPDNTLKICDEFVIFDAKSPATDDLTNFPNYLKDQTEKAKKYAKQENVKPDIFFVVPTNTLEKLSQFVYNLADYNVFIISVDSLEQIVLNLKKIEEYEFAEQLSPEERDNICRVLGKFAHLTKRRIQIDSFFAKQFIELAYKSETDLPKEILDKVIEYEKSEKLNPPIEKRTKGISVKELEKDTTKLTNEVVSKGIVIDETTISSGINELQLYKSEND
jgi:hypothetical protein